MKQLQLVYKYPRPVIQKYLCELLENHILDYQLEQELSILYILSRLEVSDEQLHDRGELIEFLWEIRNHNEGAILIGNELNLLEEMLSSTIKI